MAWASAGRGKAGWRARTSRWGVGIASLASAFCFNLVAVMRTVGKELRLNPSFRSWRAPASLSLFVPRRGSRLLLDEDLEGDLGHCRHRTRGGFSNRHGAAPPP